ncbi:calmodulin-like protein 5 [Hevea brasiliensis]|uniref:calmodulin-like protein 5 n=1 Tax=Hevea brasiliensis TaxID=3981 RepID=UPI0026015A99|nr:calmodulin-like protein 5 [Hevea brasiliensis]
MTYYINIIPSSGGRINEDQLKEIFMEYDVNGDKVLSRDEIKKAFDLIGSRFPDFRTWRLNDLVNYAFKFGIKVWIRHADNANEDPVIDLDTWLEDLINYASKIGYWSYNKNASVYLTEDQLRGIFMQFDVNHDNVLSRDEIKKAFDYIGAWFPGYRARDGIRHADANGDGVVDLNELDDLVNYACKIGYYIK